jgi:hypothetical protein
LLKNELPTSINQDEALQKLKQAVEKDESGFLVLNESEIGANYNVTVNVNSYTVHMLSLARNSSK